MIVALKYWQLILGGMVALVLGTLLVVQKGETRHFRKLYANETTLYNGAVASLSKLEGDYRLASAKAIENNQKQLASVVAANQARNEEFTNDYQARIANLYSTLRSVRAQAATAAANSSGGARSPVPNLPTPTCGSANQADDPTTQAYKCAVQLDELIRWVEKTHETSVNNNAKINAK